MTRLLGWCLLAALAAPVVAAEPVADAVAERERLRRPAPEWSGTLEELVAAVQAGGVRVAIDAPQGAVDDPRHVRVVLPSGRRSWEAALRLAAWQAALALTATADGLRLVDPRLATPVARTYPVADLLATAETESAAALEAIARSPGAIGRADAAVWNGQLVVNGSEAHQQRVAGMLAALRAAASPRAIARLWADDALEEEAPPEPLRIGRTRHWRDAPLDRIAADLRTDGVPVVVQARPARRWPLVSAEWDPRTEPPSALLARVAAAAGLGVDRLASCACIGDAVGARELRWHAHAGAADQAARLRMALKVLLAGDRAGEPAIAAWRGGWLLLASPDRHEAAASLLAAASPVASSATRAAGR